MTKDQATKHIIQIFTDRSISAKTADLFMAIDEIAELIEAAYVAGTDNANEAWRESIRRSPVISVEEATAIIAWVLG